IQHYHSLHPIPLEVKPTPEGVAQPLNQQEDSPDTEAARPRRAGGDWEPLPDLIRIWGWSP
ncbi:MAG: hypothetical protein ACRDP2_18485, partial [Nocardioidaceae bacterium]